MQNHNKKENNILIDNEYNVIDYVNIKNSLLRQNTNMNFLINEIKDNCINNIKIMKNIQN